MTPERWQRIDQLYHDALKHKTAERLAFVREICGDDKSLRQEVESLLEVHDPQDTLLDLPAAELTEVREPEMCKALGIPDSTAWLAAGCNDAAIVEVADEAAVRAVGPDFRALGKINRMAIVTSRGDTETIVSRVFVPYLGIDEDPVTGSAHAALVLYWAGRLGRNEFTALQASKRSGLLHCRLDGDRVILAGHCRTVIVGNFQI